MSPALMLSVNSNAPREFLSNLWEDAGTSGLHCCCCGREVGTESTLARTFSLRSALGGNVYAVESTRSIDVPGSNDRIVIFDRHLDCLYQTSKYVAISHVWHRDVATAQAEQGGSEDVLKRVSDLVRNIPPLICRSVLDSQGNDIEIWHDYISVPQWRQDVKRRILPKIPELFRNATLTVVYASDLDQASVLTMRQGASSQERCWALSRICNLQWFSRIWTAMEFTQSEHLQFMSKDFALLSTVPEADNLLDEMKRTWSAEIAVHGSPHPIEDMIDIGKSLLPWQLGPLEEVRKCTASGTPCSFAMAHELFARRGITNPRDFFHVLLGVLNIPALESSLSQDPQAALQEVAVTSIKTGDFSPLLMVPTGAEDSLDDLTIRLNGFWAIGVFALGMQQAELTHKEIRGESSDGIVTITAEHLGTVTDFSYDDLHKPMEDCFAAVALKTLDVVGDDDTEFVNALGGRLYGQDTERILQRLSASGQLHLVRSKLRALTKTVEKTRRKIRHKFNVCTYQDGWVTIRSMRSAWLKPFRFHLVDYVSNEDGHFSSRGKGFSRSARHISLSGTTLRAELQRRDGSWQKDELDISLVNAARTSATDEHLTWLADAMGLSNRALNCAYTELTPMAYLNGHGGSIHLVERCAIFTARCERCGKHFIMRAAMFSQNHHGTGLTAWRFPGLKYKCTTPGGCGILVEGHRIVGRFIWGSVTCDCEKLDQVKIQLNQVPLIRPNTFAYGSSR